MDYTFSTPDMWMDSVDYGAQRQTNDYSSGSMTYGTYGTYGAAMQPMITPDASRPLGPVSTGGASIGAGTASAFGTIGAGGRMGPGQGLPKASMLPATLLSLPPGLRTPAPIMAVAAAPLPQGQLPSPSVFSPSGGGGGGGGPRRGSFSFEDILASIGPAGGDPFDDTMQNHAALDEFLPGGPPTMEEAIYAEHVTRDLSAQAQLYTQHRQPPASPEATMVQSLLPPRQYQGHQVHQHIAQLGQQNQAQSQQYDGSNAIDRAQHQQFFATNMEQGGPGMVRSPATQQRPTMGYVPPQQAQALGGNAQRVPPVTFSDILNAIGPRPGYSPGASPATSPQPMFAQPPAASPSPVLFPPSPQSGARFPPSPRSGAMEADMAAMEVTPRSEQLHHHQWRGVSGLGMGKGALGPMGGDGRSDEPEKKPAAVEKVVRTRTGRTVRRPRRTSEPTPEPDASSSGGGAAKGRKASSNPFDEVKAILMGNSLTSRGSSRANSRASSRASSRATSRSNSRSSSPEPRVSAGAVAAQKVSVFRGFCMSRMQPGEKIPLVEAVAQANSSSVGGAGFSADDLRLVVRSTGPTKGLVKDPKALDISAEDMVLNSDGKVEVKLWQIESKFTTQVSLTYVTAGWSRTPDGHSCPLYKQKRRHQWPWTPARRDDDPKSGSDLLAIDGDWLSADGTALQFDLEHILYDPSQSRPTAGWVHSFLRCAGLQCKIAGGDIACTEKGQVLGSGLLCRGCVRRNSGTR